MIKKASIVYLLFFIVVPYYIFSAHDQEGCVSNEQMTTRRDKCLKSKSFYKLCVQSLFAHNITATRNVAIEGNLTVDGNVNIIGTLTVNGSPFSASISAAEYVQTIIGSNGLINPGAAVSFDTPVITMPSVTAISGPLGQGHAFQFNSTGLYVFDYEMSLLGSSAIALYTGPNVGSLVLDNQTVAGSTTTSTWIHGRAFVNVTTLPFVAMISPVGAATSVVLAGPSTNFMTRLTILKLS